MPTYTVQDTSTKKNITFEWFGQDPPTDTDMQEVFDNASANIQSQPDSKEKGLGGKLGERISNIGKELTTPSPDYIQPDPFSVISHKGTRVAGQVAGGVNDIVGAGISKLIEAAKNNPVIRQSLAPYEDVYKGADYLLGDTVKGVVKKGTDIYTGLKEKYPEQTKDVEAITNIASFIPIGKSAQLAKQGIATGIVKSKGVEAFDKAITNTFKESMPKVLRGTPNTYPQLLKQSEKLATAGKDIVINKNNLKYIDSATGMEITGKVPSNVSEMAQAWHQRMREIWGKIDNSIKEAGGTGLEIDLSNLQKDLKPVADDIGSKVFLPQESKAAKIILDNLTEENLAKLPLDKAQEIIASLNAKIGSLTTYKDIAQSKVDNIILKNLRKSLDDAILDFKGEGIRDAKKLYGSYLEGEKLLTKAVSRQMKELGGIDFMDIGSASFAASSIMSGNLPGLGGALTAKVLNMIRLRMKNPDIIIGKMFKKADNLMGKKQKYFPEDLTPNDMSLGK